MPVAVITFSSFIIKSNHPFTIHDQNKAVFEQMCAW